jgi:hypothetical protein
LEIRSCSFHFVNQDPDLVSAFAALSKLTALSIQHVTYSSINSSTAPLDTPEGLPPAGMDILNQPFLRLVLPHYIHLFLLDLPSYKDFSSEDAAVLSNATSNLRHFSLGSLNLNPDWRPAKGKLCHAGLPNLKHLCLCPCDAEKGVPVRQLRFLLGPLPQLESISPYPLPLQTQCSDLDQAAVISSLLDLLQAPLSRCSHALSLKGMMGYSAYNAHYMFRTLAPAVGHIKSFHLTRASLDCEATTAMALAMPLIQDLRLHSCEFKSGALDKLHLLSELSRLTLSSCLGVALGYPASLEFFGQSVRRQMRLQVNEETLKSMRADTDSMVRVIRQKCVNVEFKVVEAGA